MAQQRQLAGPRAADPSSLRSFFVHQEGVVSLAYSPDSTFLYSSGSDALIRRFDLASPDDDPEIIDQHNEPITSLDASLDHLVSASESGEVALFTHAGDVKGKTSFETFLTRSPLAIRCVRFDPSGRRVAVASDELIVKIVDVRDPLRIRLLTGHQKSVRSVSWSPDSNLIASSGCEGAIRIWEVHAGKDGPDPVCTQVIEDVIPSAEPESLYSVEAVWHPSGKFFVVPAKTHEIAQVSREAGWRVTATFGSASSSGATSGHASDISSVAFSPNCNYLASAGKDEVVFVWDTQTRQAIARLRLETGGLGTAIRWQPNGNSLTVADHTGQLTRWDRVIDTAQGESHPAHAPRSVGAAAPAVSAPKPLPTLDDGFAAEDFDDLGDEGADDWMIDADESPTSRIRKPSLGPNRRSDLVVSRPSAQSGASSSVTAGQAPFQPGATKTKDRRRYLAFNLIGVVHVLEKDDQENMVTIGFHDESARKGYNFPDPFKFSLAALGELGVLFASSTAAGGQAVVRYEAYETWPSSALGDSSRSWQCELPAGEDVVAIAFGGVMDSDADREARHGLVGSGTAVVATGNGFLRFFTGSGLQKYVWNLGAGLVSLACSHDWALVIVRGAGDAAIGGQQNLRYLLIDTDSFEIIQEGPVPLAKGVTLNWCGFSEDGTIPTIFDSRGTLSFLHRARKPKQARWVPVLDTQRLKKEGRTEAYWPVGVSATQMMCIILKGGETQPGFPTPLLQDVNLEMPLLRMDDAQGALEESFLRGHMLVEHRRDLADADDFKATSNLAHEELEVDKTLLKLIQTACKSDKAAQALDAAQLLNQPKSVEAAAKIAAFFRLQDLQERIEMISEARKSGFVSSRWRRDEEKRRNKYAHLEDLRTIPDSRVPKGHGGPDHEASASAILSKPFGKAAVSGDRGAKRGGALSNGKIFTKPVPERMARGDEGLSSDPHGLGGEEEAERWDQSDVPDPVEDVLSPAQAGHVEPRPGGGARSKITGNPFSKAQTQPQNENLASSSPQPSTNPFASTKGGAQNKAALRKSGSFFDRVDNYEKAGAVKASKQTTLFGVAPPSQSADEGKKVTEKGKKRKKADDADQGDVGQQGARKAKKGGLEIFLRKSRDRPSVTAADVTMDDIEPSPQHSAEEEGEESQASLAPINYDESQDVPRVRTAQPVISESIPAGNGIDKFAAFRAQ